MTQKIYSLISGILFTLVALSHLGRIVQGWDITAAGTVVPMWVSWIGLVITAILASFGLKFGLKSGSATSK